MTSIHPETAIRNLSVARRQPPAWERGVDFGSDWSDVAEPAEGSDEWERAVIEAWLATCEWRDEATAEASARRASNDTATPDPADVEQPPPRDPATEPEQAQGPPRAARKAAQRRQTAGLKLYQKKTAFWIDRGDGSLAGPHTDAELGPVLFQDHNVRDPGAVRIAKHERCHVVDTVFANYLARRTTFLPDEAGERGAIEIATVRWREVSPREHPRIGEWLDRLGGDVGAPFLKAWIAALWDLDKPAPMLHITGARHVGKGLLAACCASIYGERPVDGKDATSQFNANLQRCPIVWLDEGPPPGMTLSDLRTAITCDCRPLNQKFEQKFDLRGHTRWLCCMNNAEGFPFIQKGAVTSEDIQAVADRITWIECPPDPKAHDGENAPAAVYLRELKEELRSWVDGGFAEHAAWLRDTRTGCAPVRKGDRMAAPAHRGDVIVRRMSKAGHDAQLRLIADFLESPSSVIAEPHSPFERPGALVTRGGECWARANWLEERTRELVCIGGPHGKRRDRTRGQTYYRAVDLAKLRQALPDRDWEAIEATLRGEHSA